MPIFEYRCNKCEEILEILITSGKDENEVQCKKCGSKNLEKLISLPFVSVSENSANLSHCGRQTTCCGSPTPCDKRPCDS